MGNSRSLLDFLTRLAGTVDPAIPDTQLLELFHRTRDDAAFAALVRRHGALVLGVCRRVLRDEQDAEDAFQATFLTLARKGTSVRLQTSLSCWLYKVAYRLALRLKTRTARERSTPEPPENRTDQNRSVDPEGDLTWQEIRAVLDDELQHLPEAYRAPLVLCYLAGKTLDEAAEQLGWTTGSVKGRLERGRRMLRERLGRRGLTFPAALMALGLAQATDAAICPDLVAVIVKGAVGLALGAEVPEVPAKVMELVKFGVSAASMNARGVLAICFSAIAAVGLCVGLFLTSGSEPDPPPPPPKLRAALAVEDTSRAVAFRDVAPFCGLEAIAEETARTNRKWQLESLHMVDLDGDGHLDVFLSGYGKGQSVVALNDGKGHFRRAPGVDLGDRGIQLVCDLNGSGRPDFTTLTPGGTTEWWANRSRPGHLQFEQMKISRGGDTGRRQAIIDINRDGRVDWVRGTRNEIVAELGDDEGRFGMAAILLKAGELFSNYELLCLPVDINDDGYIDFLVETGHGANGMKTGNSRIYLNDGKMVFRDATTECGLPAGVNVAIKGAGDVNQDGYPDLLVFEEKKPEVYLNDGKGKFTKLHGAITGMERAVKPQYVSWGIAVITDIDNDGVPDLIWNGQYFLWVLRGMGGGTFKYVNPEWGIKDLAASRVDGGLCFGDLDGDGRLDIIGYTSWADQRKFAAYRNELPMRNWLRVRPIGLPGNRGAAGSKIRLYSPGTNRLLWYEQVATYDSQSAQSYYSYAETERHYGLGDRRAADVEVEFYPSGKKVRIANVPANGVVRVSEGAP